MRTCKALKVYCDCAATGTLTACARAAASDHSRATAVTTYSHVSRISWQRSAARSLSPILKNDVELRRADAAKRAPQACHSMLDELHAQYIIWLMAGRVKYKNKRRFTCRMESETAILRVQHGKRRGQGFGVAG